jgi:putative FmdB family regulatory protein
MPIYEYACDKCEHEFEREQRMADPPIKTCPKCKGRKVTKLISRSSFVLKGGGWYADGYADPKKAETPSKTAESSNDDQTATADSSKASKEKSKGSEGSAKGKKANKKSAA